MSRRHPHAHGDHDETASYSLDELVREADVTQRTIRYYIAEGLLPPPDSAGRNARYSQEHLDRLRLIGQMKQAYLPLKEIRARLAAMSPEEIRNAIAPPRASTAPPAAEKRMSSAVEYISHTLQESSARYSVAESRSMPAPRMQEPLSDRMPDRSWKRIVLTDDAELLVTEEAWERRGDRIESALQWIRRMLE
jgi:DNA-binding transcriptional MerR regulator